MPLPDFPRFALDFLVVHDFSFQNHSACTRLFLSVHLLRG